MKKMEERVKESEERIKESEERVKESEEQGIQKGLEQGIQEGIKKIALSMLENGFSLEQISKCTGLTIEQVELLKID